MSNFDGSLRFNTELDNEGFDKNSDKLLSSISSLAKQIDQLGQNMMQSFTGLTAILQQLAAASQRTATGMNDAAHRTAMAGAEAAVSLENAVSSTENMSASQTQQMSATEGAARVTEEAAAIQGAATQTIGEMTEATDQLATTQSSAEQTMNQGIQSISAYDAQIEQLRGQIAEAEGSLSEYYDQLDKLATIRDRAMEEKYPGWEQDVAAAEAGIDALNQKYAGQIKNVEGLEYALRDAINGRKAAAQQAAQATDQAAQATQNLASAQERVSETANSSSAAMSNYDKQIEKINSKIAETEKKLTESGYYEQLDFLASIRDKAEMKGNQGDVEAADAAIDRLNAKHEKELSTLEALEDQLKRVNAARQEAAQAPKSESSDNGEGVQQAGDAARNTAPAARALTNVLLGLGKALTTVGGYALNFARRITTISFHTLTSGIRGAVSALGVLASKIKTVSLNMLASGFKSITSSLKKFTAQSKKTTFASNALVKSLTSIKRLLLTRIKRMFISSIFNTVREGIQQLAKFDKEFNKTMSNIKNNATRLGGNIAITVANIIKTFEPLITTLLNLLNKVFTLINQVFAVLQGKNTYAAAKMGTEDYAKAADKAAKKQKKLNAELYSYDELTRQQKKDSDDDESKIQYETKAVDLPKGVMGWLEKLKKLWQGGDWYNFGYTLAEGLNAAMAYVDNWINSKFRPWLVTWVTRIGSIINGLIDGLNWELLGKTIADGMNAIFDGLEHFLDTVRWEDLGRGIGRAIVSWFRNIDLEMIGRVFAKKWMALVHIIKGIVTTPGFWTGLGEAIADLIRGWFEGIDFDDIADTVIAILNGIPEAIQTFLDGDPFAGVPQRIFNALNRVIHEVEWETLIGSIADLIIYLVDQIRQTLAGIDWDQVFDNMRNMGVVFFNKILTYLGSINWGEVTATLTNGFNQLVGMINDIIGQPGFWESVATTLVNAVLGWFSGISYDDIATMLINLINGATTVLETFLSTDGFGTVWQSITNALQRVIHEVRWADLLNALTTLFRNVLNGILDVADTINWPEVATKVGTALASLPWGRIFETLWTILKGLITGLLSSGDGRVILAVAAGIIGLKTGILGAIRKLGAGLLSGLLVKIPGFLGKILSPIGTALTTKLPGIIAGAAPTIVGALSKLGAIIFPAATAALCIYDTVKLAQLGAEFVAVTEEYDTAVSNEVNTAVTSMQTCFANGGQDMVTKWMEMAYGVQSTGQGMEADMRALATRIAELQGTSAGEIYNQLVTSCDNIILATETTGSSVVSSATTSSQSAEEAIMAGMFSMNAGTKSMLEVYLGLVESHGIDVANEWFKMVSGVELFNDNLCQNQEETQQIIIANMEAVSEFARTNTNSTLTNMNSTVSTGMSDLKGTTTQGMTDLHTATDTGMQQVKSDIVSNIKTAGDEVKKQNWNEVGDGVTQGIGGGIESGWDWLQKKVSSIAQGLLNAAKNALGINSPSKVFSDIIGGGVTEGWALGMEQTKGDVLRTVSNISNALVDEAENGPMIETQLDATMDGTISGMQSVVNGLSDIALTFKTIADTLTTIGGFTAPQIATGTVVPYKTKVAAESPSEAVTDGSTTLLSGIEASMQRIIELLQNSGNQEQIVKVLIDGREVFTAMVNENNRAIQRTGTSPIRR